MITGESSKLSSSVISIPLANLASADGSVTASLGIGVSVEAVPNLGKLGLFDHHVAEKIAKKIFEPNGPTLTSQWMDATGPFRDLYPRGVQLGWHRVFHGHFITDAVTVLKDSRLSCVDFLRHLATDIVTKNGIPILPASVIRPIADTLGISVSQVSKWASINILDAGASILAVGHAGGEVVDILMGTAQWSTGYAINTFGGGACEGASGIASQNPILVGTGAADIICGAVTACDYYSQPFICGVPVMDILQTSSISMSIASILSVAELFNHNTTSVEKVKNVSEKILSSGVISALSVISLPVSVTTAFGMSGIKLAIKQAEDTDNYISSMPIMGKFAKRVDSMIIDRYIGRENFNNIKARKGKKHDQ